MDGDSSVMILISTSDPVGYQTFDKLVQIWQLNASRWDEVFEQNDTSIQLVLEFASRALFCLNLMSVSSYLRFVLKNGTIICKGQLIPQTCC